ncbi:hypothetical protein R5R35_009452 [Gryllus longicercus]|uniref:Uncharacterized protein n=1 Tax=Gryllus longicercus TaxID=2509291 RepID=A0AAN9W1Y0_9ORTH
MCSENSSGRSSSAAAAPESRRVSLAACEGPLEASWAVGSGCCGFRLDAVPLPWRLVALPAPRRTSFFLRGAAPALPENAFRGRGEEPQRAKQPRSGLPEIRPFGKQRRNAKRVKDSGLPSFGRNKDVDGKDVQCCAEFHTLSSPSRCVHGGGGGGGGFPRCVVEGSAGHLAHLTVTGCAIAAPPAPPPAAPWPLRRALRPRARQPLTQPTKRSAFSGCT